MSCGCPACDDMPARMYGQTCTVRRLPFSRTHARRSRFFHPRKTI